MKISLLTEIQRKRLEEILYPNNLKLVDKKHQATIRKTKSLLNHEFRDAGYVKLIESLIRDLGLLDAFWKKGKITIPTVTDLLIMEVFKEYPDDRIGLLVRSAKHAKEAKKQRVWAGLKIKDISLNNPFPPAYTHVIMDGTNKGDIYRLLHDTFMRSVVLGESEYLTQKEIKNVMRVSEGTISKELNNLINEGLVECDEKTKLKKYRCVTVPDNYPYRLKKNNKNI